MNRMAEKIQDTIIKLHKAVTDYHEGLARIDREFESLQKRLTREQTRNRESRKLNWQSRFANEWKRISTEITQTYSRLRQRQLAFIDFGPNKPMLTSEIPASLILGSYHISFEKFTSLVPHVIQFPFTSAIAFPQDSAEQKLFVHHLLLRLLSALPPGRLELTLIDPLQQGQSVEPFLPLLKVKQFVQQGRVLTRSDQIETVLDKLTVEVEDLIQHRFNESASNWSEYNVNHADALLPYKVVLVFDTPEQLSDKSIWFLGRLCENGPRCGVLPIIAIEDKRIEDKRYERFRATLKNSTMQFDALVYSGSIEGLTFTYQPEQWPRQDVLDDFMSMLAEQYAATIRFKKTMPDLWTSFTKRISALDGFNIPIGWTPVGEIVSLRLGATDSEHHSLLAGKTGSGKSNLLHVLIHSLCEKYPPEEVDLYLLDYKESTEFNVYADPPLSHARLVATESDPEYGITVLRHLADELEKRAYLFKSASVRDFTEYRKESREKLARILLVIDEFQVLFSEDRKVAECAEQLLAQLLKQGRSFGIHILLATQTLKNINALSIGSLTSQLGCRIALACGQEDSAQVLGPNNYAAAELRSPPEGIINNANGAKSGNVKFMIPLAESAFCRKHIAQLSEMASKHDLTGKTKIFSGAKLPTAPSLSEYQLVYEKTQTEALLLGKELTYNADTLAVPLTRRPAFNILFSGYNDQIHDGLLTATLFSMASFTNGFEEIVYFNGRGVVPGGGFSAAVQALGARFKEFDDIAMLPLQRIVDDIGTQRTALVIDGLDSEKTLYPIPAFKTPKPGDPPTPSDLLKYIAEEGSRKGTFVFVFVDRWQRCATACKDLFSFFELRIAYCMNEDDAGALKSGGIGKFKGIEKPNRAVFVNKMTNDTTWFRPYVQENTR